MGGGRDLVSTLEKRVSIIPVSLPTWVLTYPSEKPGSETDMTFVGQTQDGRVELRPLR